MEITLENSKYNLPECLKFSINNEEALKMLIKKYHDSFFTPNFIYRILKDMPHRHREGIRINPKLYSFGILENNEPEFILIPNAPKSNHESLMKNPKHEKNTKNGLYLVGYYIHQDQIANSIFSELSDRKKLSNGDISFLRHIEKQYLRIGTPEERHILPRNNSFSYELDRIDNKKIDNQEYLVTIAHLKSNHIQYLKKIKKFITKQLTEIYDVDFQRDKIEMFFHFPTNIKTSILHIHVRINALVPHKIEIGTRYYLDDIIQELERNGNLYSLILKRNPNYTTEDFTCEVLEDIKGIEYQIIQNPYSIYSDKMHEISKKELDMYCDTLKYFFSKEEIEYLYLYERNYKYININKEMLSKYLNNDVVEIILQNKSFFFDLNDNRKVRGRFEKQFSDKFNKNKKLFKKTRFNYKDISSKINNYEVYFADDDDYISGITTCVGEISNDCESLGKNGTNYIFFDMLSDDSRRFFIKKDGKIIGQSLIFIDNKKETLIISSLNCIQSIDQKVIRAIIEDFSISLLKANTDIKRISIGVGGRNFITMNCEDIPKTWQKTIKEQTKTWQALQRLRKNPNPDNNDVLLCSKSIGYPIDLESNISIRIKDEKLYHMTPQERLDTYRIATIIDRENIIEKEILNRQKIKELKEKNIGLSTSIGNNQTKNITTRQNEFMELIQALIKDKLNCCYPIKQTEVQYNNKKYSSFVIECLDEEEKINIKKIIINILGQEQIYFQDSIDLQKHKINENNRGLIFSVKMELLGFDEKNIINKLKAFLEIKKDTK